MSDFLLPDIGEGIVECEVVKWLVREGDVIDEDQPVAEVTTDKALVEIPAPHAGRVTRLYYREGETARVHSPLFAIAEDGDPDTTADTSAGTFTEPPRPAAATPDAELPQPPSAASETNGDVHRDFLLPDLGEGIVECEVVAWRLAQGEAFDEDQPVVEVSTDKAVMEITAPEAGRLVRRGCEVGESVRVHASLFVYAPANHVDVPRETLAQSGTSASKRASNSPALSTASASPARQRIPASPAVRRQVRELGLSLEQIAGSGKDGRVLKEDVLAHRQRQDSGQTSAPGESRAASGDEASSITGSPGDSADRVEPLTGIRAVMARRMSEAAASIPHFAYGDEFDVTELLTLRERLKGDFEARGERLTLMPLLMKALALAVSAFPLLNSRLDEAGNAIQYRSACNIGMAVDGKAGLIVPNVKGVERLTLRDVAAEVERLTRAARDGRVDPADLKGGTISISNIGVLGGTYAMPIINAPEVAIVALGRVQRLPRFAEDGTLVSRSIMTVTWSGDHRVLDGGTMARFCNRWKGYLEAPQTMLTDLR